MAILSVAGRNAAANGVLSLLNGGSLVFFTASGAVAATLGLGSPAFFPANNGRAAARNIDPDLSPQGGLAVNYELRNAAGVALVMGTVGAFSGDIRLADNNIIPSQAFTIDLFVYSQSGE